MNDQVDAASVDGPTTAKWSEPGGKIGMFPTGFLATDWFRNVATFLAIVAAMTGILIQEDHAQDLAERQNLLTREMSADTMWTGYMELAIEYPQFADGAPYDGLKEREIVQYMWLFDRLAYTAESILLFQPENEAWISVFETEIGKHVDLLENHPRFLPDYLCDYDEPVRLMISKASELAREQNKKCERSDADEAAE